MEFAVDSKVADAFFSLHCNGDEEPIYISELAEKATVRHPPSSLLPKRASAGRSLGRANGVELTRPSAELQLSLLRTVRTRAGYHEIPPFHAQSLDEEA
jgi:hypothetical protein